MTNVQVLLPQADQHPPWLERLFPWLSSTTFHAGIFLVFVFALYIGHHVVADDSVQISIPTPFDITSSIIEHKSDNPGENLDPFRPAHSLIPNNDNGWTVTKGPADTSALLEGTKGDTDAELIVLGKGVGTKNGRDGAGIGSLGGPLASLGTPGGGNPGIIFTEPKSIPAKRVVYILDHSGSMLDSFDYLRQEAVRSVQKMLPVQQFSIVMVSEQASAIFPALQRTTPAIKTEFADKFQNYRTQGMNDDLLPPFKEAFEKAFATNPEVIYFLTDGHFDPKLMEVVNTLNKNHKVRINTIAFVNHDSSYEDQLKSMAKQNSGAYKFISAADLK